VDSFLSFVSFSNPNATYEQSFKLEQGPRRRQGWYISSGAYRLTSSVSPASQPDATLSESKVKLINRLLKDVRFVLAKEPDFKYLDLLVSAALPQNSDVMLILSQYTAAMDRFHKSYYGWDDRTKKSRWFVTDK